VPDRSPGQVACEAFWTAVGAGPDGAPIDLAWKWAETAKTRAAWEEAARAVLESGKEMSNADA
jgi:hypothetical protein